MIQALGTDLGSRLSRLGRRALAQAPLLREGVVQADVGHVVQDVLDDLHRLALVRLCRADLRDMVADAEALLGLLPRVVHLPRARASNALSTPVLV